MLDRLGWCWRLVATGLCFAGLDESGVLNIFQGHPTSAYYRSVWSSTPTSDIIPFGGWFYQMKLYPTGLLEIQRIQHNLMTQCVWTSASSSCNELASALRMTTTRFQIVLKRSFAVSNLQSLPARVMNSNLVKSVKSAVVGMLQVISTNVRVLRCYTQYMFNKYIIQASAGEESGGRLDECVRAANGVYARNKSHRRRRGL